MMDIINQMMMNLHFSMRRNIKTIIKMITKMITKMKPKKRFLHTFHNARNEKGTAQGKKAVDVNDDVSKEDEAANGQNR